jgi:hypothetical protein
MRDLAADQQAAVAGSLRGFPAHPRKSTYGVTSATSPTSRSAVRSAVRAGTPPHRRRPMTVAARSSVNGWPTMKRTPRASQASKKAWEQPALSVRTMTDCVAGSTGSWASVASRTWIWSAAVPDHGSPVASKVARRG